MQNALIHKPVTETALLLCLNQNYGVTAVAAYRMLTMSVLLDAKLIANLQEEEKIHTGTPKSKSSGF
jgi:hypothetical protein